jgi:hypothetical protein
LASSLPATSVNRAVGTFASLAIRTTVFDDKMPKRGH